jgi:putative DNA primase/helicase
VKTPGLVEAKPKPKNGAPLVAGELDAFREQVAGLDLHKFALTDYGNAERLVRDHGKDLRYCAPKRKWYVWTGTHWQQDETGELVRLAKSTARRIYAEASRCDDADRRKAITKHALASERAPRIVAMVELAQSESGVPVLPCELDADPWLFCCRNGTIDLRSGQLLTHRQRDLITRLSPVDYVPDAKSELWDSYLATATNRDKELEAYIQRAVGYSLQGTVTERRFFFVFGPPGGTKSTFIETIGAAFGAYHQPADFETWLLQTYTGGNRGDLVRLAGARLVTSVEVRKDARFDEGLIKRVTGGDPLTAAAKYESEVTFQPAFTLWLAANDPPAIRDDDQGMWDRICRIPFTHALSVEQQDRTMREQLRDPKVLSAVLAWSVRGCLEWQKRGLGACAAVDASVAEYRTAMDRVAGFLDSECVFAPNVQVLTKKLRQAYETWCDEMSARPLSGNDLAKRLEARGCQNVKNHGYRYWKGVRLVDELFDSRGAAVAAGTAFPGNPPRERNMGRVPGNGDPGDPGDPAQKELDPDEFEAEQACRGTNADECRDFPRILNSRARARGRQARWTGCPEALFRVRKVLPTGESSLFSRS